MPPPRSKKSNQRAKGRHVGSFDEVAERNRATPTPDAPNGGDDSSSEEEVKPKAEEKAQEERKPAQRQQRYDVAGNAIANPNANAPNVEAEGMELTRRQREEIEKAAARRRYEQMHKAGETDEAKADLARLQEVKKRREEAAAKRLEEEATRKVKEKEVASKDTSTNKEHKAALGGEASRRPGDRSKASKKKEKEEAPAAAAPEPVRIVRPNPAEVCGLIDATEASAAAASDAAAAPAAPRVAPVRDGTIKSCREVEDDFM
eukprot:NODE_14617_length_1097_cov_5.060825.p2 GENE.NODE_14617_length_1097_cov_5.060825~~NODE_14617_length_1097_cov_5.060825.p2  ORF type:complete len:261 (-),score=95.37 NODE_14617_length_1097_cov_5.060825:255-1037(-)